MLDFISLIFNEYMTKLIKKISRRNHINGWKIRSWTSSLDKSCGTKKAPILGAL